MLAIIDIIFSYLELLINLRVLIMNLLRTYNVCGYLGSISNIQAKNVLYSITDGPSSVSAKLTNLFSRFGVLKL